MQEELQRLKALEQEHSGLIIKELNQIVHRPAGISEHNELIANYVRFECKIGDIYLIGTNHENTREQREEVLGFAREIKSRGVKTLYIEQCGDSPKNNLNKWLSRNGYIEESEDNGELDLLASVARRVGINVVNIDLANNPSASVYAVENFGVERTVKALNSYLSLKADSFYNDNSLAKEAIPEIIKNILKETGKEVSESDIDAIIRTQGDYPNDFFTDAEREKYMSSQLTGNKYAVAAHTAHTASLLARNLSAKNVDGIKITIDYEKIERVSAGGY